MSPPRLKTRSRCNLCVLFLVGTCVILTLFCACLIAALVLLQAHFTNELFSPVVASTGNRSSGLAIDDVVMSNDQAPAFAPLEKPWESDFRLPTDVLPLHYDLLLNPDLVDGVFSGEVTIRIDVKRPRTFLAVNLKRLNISETRLYADNSSDLAVTAFEYQKNEFWVVQVPGNATLQPGIYNLNMKFEGILKGKIVGFYQSVYKDQKTGEKRTIATSKFEPTYARQAFPCFDEPHMKATFAIRLVRPTVTYNALSNMKIMDSLPNVPSTGLTTDVFETTVPMSTYLACFIVSDFTALPPEQISNPPGSEVATFPFSVYGTPAQTTAQKTKFALETGVSVVNYYIEYFGIAYPLTKLDMIAIPDFVSGAMEHWGLITFREVNLLESSEISSTANRQRVATVIAHELAHMWFGNLVTMLWWDDLWLNEGFASYMEYKGTAHAYGDWNMMDQFLIDDLHPVLKLDAALSSHPIIQSVGHPDQITEIFDTISYNKGAAVIRMLENFLTEVIFEKGIQQYLTEFKFSNAQTKDLWKALQNQTTENIDVTDIMNTWTLQMGFPVITVKKEGIGYTFRQERFLADPDANTTGLDSDYGYKWEVPITFITDKSNVDDPTTPNKYWLTRSVESLFVGVQDAAWIKVNFRQIGYYRVNYETSAWQAFIDALLADIKVLNAPDRASLLDDAFSLADAGLVEFKTALDMSRYLVAEVDYVPWSVASSKLSFLNSILTDSLAFPKLRTYVHKLVKDVVAEVTWDIAEGDTHLHKRLRATVLDLACSLGDSDCLLQVGSKFSTWINNPAVRPHPDLRTMIYYYGLSSASSEENWDKMWELYLNEKDAPEKVKLMYGLAAAKEPWLLRRYLQYAKNETLVRSQDYFSVLTYISQNPIGTPIVWDFVRAEWEYLVDRFTLNERNLGRLIPSITSSFTTEFKLKEMEAFFELYPEAGAGQAARKQALETVANRIKWLDRNEQTVKTWLDAEIP